ncbi:hypothetical protein ACFE04_011044 [Oxalis oulophora]
MTTPSTTTTTMSSPFLPNFQAQTQQPQQVYQHNNSPSAASGPIGPFFVVISVLAILAVASCYLGRICSARRNGTVRESDPLDSIMKQERPWCCCRLDWFTRKLRCCFNDDVDQHG